MSLSTHGRLFQTEVTLETDKLNVLCDLVLQLLEYSYVSVSHNTCYDCTTVFVTGSKGGGMA